MSPQDLLNFLRQPPCRPFRIHLDDGRSFEVRHPDLLWVGHRVAVLGISEPGPDRLLERHITLSLLHIVTIEPLDAAASARRTNPPACIPDCRPAAALRQYH
jgi:hypothetical protein